MDQELRKQVESILLERGYKKDSPEYKKEFGSICEIGDVTHNLVVEVDRIIKNHTKVCTNLRISQMNMIEGLVCMRNYVSKLVDETMRQVIASQHEVMKGEKIKRNCL